MRRLLILLLLLAPAAFPYASYSGWCEQGGAKVTVAGQASTTYVQSSYSNFTASGTGPHVTVYLAGTGTKATIYSDNAGTGLANPFPCTTTGQYQFYGDGPFDLTFSGTGITTFTIPRQANFDPTQLPQGATCYTTQMAGADTGARINNCLTLITEGTIDARGDIGALTTTPVLYPGITLLLGCGLYTSTNNPVISLAGGNSKVFGCQQGGTTELRYQGTGAGDIIRIGNSSYTTTFGGYVTLSDIMFRPMDGAVATVAVHAYNPLWLDFQRLWITHSSCTGFDTDPSPFQGGCNSPGTLTNGQNIGVKLESTGHGTVPEMGQYSDSQMLFATGSGTDAFNAAGTTRDYWFDGSAASGAYLAHIHLKGTSDAESAATVFECDYCFDVMVSQGNFFSGVTPVIISHSSSLTFENVRISGAVTNNFTIDSSSADIFMWTQIVNSGTCSFTNSGTRTVLWNPASCGGFYDFGSNSVGMTNTIIRGTITQTGTGLVSLGGALESPQIIAGSGGVGGPTVGITVSYTVATLEAAYPCNSGIVSVLSYVTDLSVPAASNIGTIIAGSGSNKGHVTCNGSNWVIMGP